MSTRPGEGYDDDRLPWLETVEDDYSEGPSVWRILLLLIIGIAVLAAVIFGWWWYQQQGRITGTGELINAQEGDYKVKPDEPGGMTVEGEGDLVPALSEGAVVNGSVDLSALPEAPVVGKAAPQAPPAEAGAAKVTAEVPSASRPLQPGRPGTAPVAAPPSAARPAAGGGAVIQLGSFPDEGGANAAWARLSKRFGYLAPLGKTVERGEAKGSTVYRLRVNAGSHGQATEICGKLKVAGESCFVAN